MLRIRLIPATIATAALLMAVKAVDVVRGTEALSNNLLIAQVQAQQSGGAAPPPPAADKKADNAGKNDKGKSDKDKKNPVSETPPETVSQRFTPVQVELLQNLAERQEELDIWAKNIQIKEAALNVTEKRIDDKIAQINAMKKEVAAVLSQYNEKEDAKIHSLVEIYENMKPKDAARIFDEVEMPILLLVIDKMSEKKAAPILAGMDSGKAKQITVELAEQRRLSAASFCAAAAPVPVKTAP
ncbi:MAG: hypothetical protein KGI29_05985 [Pseudomonadota bacterium]|nr:hypothetical protein [Pseudomonadota bacterium]MDE3037110.1 hypothetical protein [Pseudomonadota bacterium]